MARRISRTLVWLFVFLASATAGAQESSAEAEIVALAEAALEAISDEDTVALTDLMIEDAVMYSIADVAGEASIRVRSWSQQREAAPTTDLVERGFAPEALVAGRVGMVWLPYDFYIDGEWSHCGVDVFTMLRDDEGWKIVSIAWTVAQPPACEPHPDGPPTSEGGR